MKISVVSGGFDPIHSGHISYLKSAKEISDYLIVALNSDNWLVNKKKRVFMSLEERKNILSNIESVDEVITFDDDADGSCINALEKIKDKYPNEKIIYICADIEDQLSGLDKSEKETFMQDIGLNKTGLNKLIKEGYDLLILETFLHLALRKVALGQ